MSHQGMEVNKQELGLKNVKVFTSTDEIAGLPSAIFLGGLAMSVGLAVAVQWWVFFVVALLYFPAMYEIHKDDPRAVTVWKRALQRKGNYWCAGKSKYVDFVVLVRKQ